MKLTTLALLPTLLLAACGGGGGTDSTRAQPTQADPPASAPAAYTLALPGGQPVLLPAEALTLQLQEVADSRCPLHAQCVWAGEAVLRISIVQAGQPEAQLRLVADGAVPAAASGRYLGYTVSVKALDPLPREPGPAPALAGYTATLRIER